MSTALAPDRISSPDHPADLPRLLSWPPAADPASLAAHLGHLGPPNHPADLARLAEEAGLRGRGGAGFPTAVKLRAVRGAAVATGLPPVVVANGSEGEPLSAKDTVLLARRPHLVLDGMVAAALAVGADWAIVCVKDGSPAVPVLQAALAERAGRDPIGLEGVLVPARYVSGEETRPGRPPERWAGRCPR